MNMFHTTRRKAILGAVGVVGALGIGGTAYAATTGSLAAAPASPVGSSSSSGKAHGDRTALARADHATYEVKVKGQWTTLTLDRGKVTAVSATSISLARPDGQTVTESISSTTKFAGVPSESAVTVGKPARIISENGTAVRIAQRPQSSATPSSTTTATGA